MHRRQFLQTAGMLSIAPGVSHAAAIAPIASTASLPLIKPKRLQPGDTVGIVSPASATFQPVDVQIAQESLEALGLKVKLGEHMMERHGEFDDTKPGAQMPTGARDLLDGLSAQFFGQLGQLLDAEIAQIRGFRNAIEQRRRRRRGICVARCHGASTILFNSGVHYLVPPRDGK